MNYPEPTFTASRMPSNIYQQEDHLPTRCTVNVGAASPIVNPAAGKAELA